MKLKTTETHLTEETLGSDSESFMSFLVISGLEHCGMAMPMDSDYDNITITKEDSTDGGIHYDDYDGGTNQCSTLSATTAARRVRNAKAGHLVSILLFVKSLIKSSLLSSWSLKKSLAICDR